MNKRDFIARYLIANRPRDAFDSVMSEALMAWKQLNEVAPARQQAQKCKSDLEKLVLDELNEISSSRFKSGQDLKARIDEGYQFEDFKLMLVYKWNEWRGTDFEKYFQPSTLFRKSKFEGYLNDAIRATNGAYSRADKVRELLGQ